MTLQTQYVQVDFGGTLDQKTDQRAVIPGNFTSAVNCVYTKSGAIQKRPGNEILTNTVFRGGSLPPSRSLVPLDGQLLMYGQHSLFSLQENDTSWVQKQQVPEPTVTGNVITHNCVNISSLSSAYCNGYIIHIYLSDAIDVLATVIDAAGTRIYNNYPVRLGPNITSPSVVAVGTKAIVTYVDNASHIYTVTLDLASPTSWSAESTLVSDIDGPYELCSLTNRFALIYKDANATTTLRVKTFSGSLVPIANTSITPPLSNINYVAIVGDISSNNLWCSYECDNTTNLFRVRAARLRADTLAVLTGDFTVSTTTSPNKQVVSGGIELISTGVDAVVVAQSLPFEFISPDSNMHLYDGTWKQNITGAGGIVGFRTTAYSSLVLASKPFTVDGKVYVSMVDTQDKTIFIVDILADDTTTSSNVIMRPVATYANYIAGVNISKLANAIVSTGTSIIISYVISRNGINTYFVEFGTPFTFAYVATTLCSSGGVPSSFDGERLSELGFLLRPQLINPKALVGGATTMPDGTYRYKVTYEWTDMKGQIYRSAPSDPTVITLGAAGGCRFEITYNTLSVKQGNVSPELSASIIIAIYKEYPAGSGTYRRYTPPDFIFNKDYINKVTNGVSLAFTDRGEDDVFLPTNELLYSQLQLQNDHPPSSSITLIHNERVWLAGCDDATQVWASKKLTQGESPGFSINIQFRIADGGPITGLGSLDEKLIIFKRDRIYVVYGDGPNELGAGGDFSVQRISTDNGCVAARSVVTTKNGLMYMSAIGICLLDRSLQTSYIGNLVEDTVKSYSEGAVTSAVVHPKNPWVMFTMGPDGKGDGAVILYDYFQNKWSTWLLSDYPNTTSAFVNSASLYNDLYTWITVGGGVPNVYQESQTLFTDNGHYVTMDVQTAWLKFAGLMGFQRVRQVAILGRERSPHTLEMSFATNYDSSGFSEVYTYASSVLTGTSEQFRSYVVGQKCSSLRVRIRDLSPGSGIGTGEGLSMTGLGLIIGAKQGIARMPIVQGG